MNYNVELINHANYIYIDDTDEFEDSVLKWEEEEKILRHAHDIIEIKEEISPEDNIDLKFYQELVNCESVFNQIEDYDANITSESDFSGCMDNHSGDEEIDVKSVTVEQSLINHNLSVLSPKCHSITNETTLLPHSRTLRDRQKLKRIVPVDLEIEPTIKFKRGKKNKRLSKNITTKTISTVKTIIPREKPKKRFRRRLENWRICHNKKEIQRRSELRHALETLRDLVPKVRCRDRASKVNILQEATIYCKQLSVQNRWQQNEFVKLCREQERLSERVSKLQ